LADVATAIGVPVQIAYAVADVEAAAASFAERFGAGPFFVRHHPQFEAIHDHSPALFNHSSAYGQWGAMQVELVQLGACSPVSLHRQLTNDGGIHHVAMFVESLSAEQARLEALGMPCVMQATTPSGLQFAFHDGRAELGHLIEIYEPADSVLRLYRMVRDAARDWDGNDPVRSI
jgi:catechol 2,3-dioxygenase-like lactoylglutathione lyase family enzyme